MVVHEGELPHHALPVHVGAGHHGREHVLGREDAGSAAQLHEVFLSGKGNLPRLFPVEHEFGPEAPFGRLVLESIGDGTLQADLLRKLMHGPETGLQAQALHVVIHDGTRPSAKAYSNLVYLVIAGYQAVGNGVTPFVQVGGLNLIHHLVDAPFPFAQLVGTDLVPVFVVLGTDFLHHHRVFRLHYFRVCDGSVGGRVVNLVPPAQEGHDPGGIADGDGEIGKEVFLPVEPASVFRPPVFHVYVDVADPVDVGRRGQLHMGGTDAEVLGVNLHFPVENGGGDQALGVEAEDVSLASFHLQAVHQEVIVEDMGR